MELTWPFPTKIQARYGIVPSQLSCPRWVVEWAWLDLLSPRSCANTSRVWGHRTCTQPVWQTRDALSWQTLQQATQSSFYSIHMDSACSCYLQLPWIVAELTASLSLGVFREYVRLSNGVELSSCNPNHILSLHEYRGRVFPKGLKDTQLLWE